MKKLCFYIFLVSFALTGNSLAQNVVGFLIPVSGLGDQSFNDMTYAGLIQSKNIYNFKLLREHIAGNDLESRRSSMNKLITQGANIIVTNGWESNDVVQEYAKKYPEKFFIINDFPLSGLANVISTVYGQHEGSFLAGALAAWTSKSKKIGFIGGKDIPVIRAFQTGYKEGALYANKDIQIYNIFLSQKGEETSGFDDPGLAYERATSLYGKDVDIIFSVAGLSGNGIIRAAAENKKFVIGVDADQDHMAKGYVLTSVIKRLDRATSDALRLIFENNFSPGIHIFGLKEDGVALSPMTYTRHLIPPDVLKTIDTLKSKIITGEIQVTNLLNNQ